MATEVIDTKAKFIRGFSDKTRLQILECLKQNEKTVSELVEELQGNQSNISQHLSCLKGCGLIVGRQEGKYVYYRLRSEQITEMLNLIDLVFEQVGNEVDKCDSHLY
ncbi:metalloregulator ArsR/SmtB family transcription factor [Paenibacillus sp. LMG 31458]|uniref:Metalloregulator ArsR/SmtB family transcription factor n=1 Tax=Paenibacillus phytorum TaxID=2654977 RepID=A0ABX1XY09_9BACL|nr:metalloregulator ArsR/SmtB family transcription factor [Paenibacillus phytorum]NOU73432.1 metalloregulator ArsR/SmtB family transcription factor [Paenibacillus phytorum]